jgi:hypothetical protein
MGQTREERVARIASGDRVHQHTAGAAGKVSWHLKCERSKYIATYFSTIVTVTKDKF